MNREERISNYNDRLLKVIDEQLLKVNLELMKDVENLVYQKSLTEIIKLLKDKKISSEQLVAYYLMRIKKFDQSPKGNNAICELNPFAIDEAKLCDISDSDFILKGIPVLIKDNINTNNMPTSAGTIALKDFTPQNNATVVEELKKNGAIILGKTNLSELAYWMSTESPYGYSSKKGQTHNPFNPLNLSPLGSSTGSAVAVATDLATFALGTETAGSIVAPSSVNSVVGYKPTRKRENTFDIIPISYNLDTVGVITKTVEDSYIAFNGMSKNKLNIVFDENYIKNKKIGVLNNIQGNAELLKILKNLDVNVVEFDLNEEEIDLIFLLQNSFENDFNKYLQENNASIRSLEELLDFNRKNPDERMKYGQNLLELSLNCEIDFEKQNTIIEKAKKMLNSIFLDNSFDAIIGINYSISTFAAVAGYPEISVPMGLFEDCPIGATFVTRENNDEQLLKLAYSFEFLTKLRKLPHQY